MRFGVITFPGSNCDQDLVYVIEQVLNEECVRLWHKDTDLKKCDFIFLPGGFSYGDYLRSGAIARFAPIMQEVVKFAAGGGYVAGICNGFQILTEAGLLPGALMLNASTRFVSRHVHVTPSTTRSFFTTYLERRPYRIPIAHAEGNYYCDSATLESLTDDDRIVFRYTDEAGNPTQDANPNGSLLNIAGICNEKRNVIGMMPHPERASDAFMGNCDGLHLFLSLLNSFGN